MADVQISKYFVDIPVQSSPYPLLSIEKEISWCRRNCTGYTEFGFSNTNDKATFGFGSYDEYLVFYIKFRR